MKTKKYISIVLVILLMFSFCSFSSYAADGISDITISDFDISATENYKITNDDGTSFGGTKPIDYTDTLISSGTWKNFTRFSLDPVDIADSSTEYRRLLATLRLDENFDLSDGHEYSLKFNWGFNVSLPVDLKIVISFFNNSGLLLKEQILFEANDIRTSNTVQYVDFNFTPVAPEDQGYKALLRIYLTQDGYNSTTASQSFYISNDIKLIDKDDDTGLINSIISAIKEIPEKIKGFFTELADNIKGFFDSLKNYILYFQDPVILNEEGVLVDENGQPIYINPFENSIEDIEKTFNGWIEDIRNFISNMDESRVQVSGYLQTGTGLINDILGASPIISAVLVFIASFFVIRKVVGR